MLNDQDDLVKITTSHNNEEAEMVELADSAEWGPFCQELLAKAGICEAAFSAITLRDHMLISKNELASLCKQKNISLTLTNSTQVAVEEAQLAFTKATQSAYHTNLRYEMKLDNVALEEEHFKEAESKLKVIVQRNGGDPSNQVMINLIYKNYDGSSSHQ